MFRAGESALKTWARHGNWDTLQNDQHLSAMKLKEIHRTATFAWSPFSDPLLVSGTVAGALDESFSNDSQLEIWAPDFKDKSEYDLGQLDQNKPKASITASSKYAYLSK